MRASKIDKLKRNSLYEKGNFKTRLSNYSSPLQIRNFLREKFLIF